MSQFLTSVATANPSRVLQHVLLPRTHSRPINWLKSNIIHQGSDTDNFIGTFSNKSHGIGDILVGHLKTVEHLLVEMDGIFNDIQQLSFAVGSRFWAPLVRSTIDKLFLPDSWLRTGLPPLFFRLCPVTVPVLFDGLFGSFCNLMGLFGFLAVFWILVISSMKPPFLPKKCLEASYSINLLSHYVVGRIRNTGGISLISASLLRRSRNILNQFDSSPSSSLQAGWPRLVGFSWAISIDVKTNSFTESCY